MPLFVAFSIQNASNLVFHVTVSRLIGPSRYSELAALLGVAFVVSVPVGVVQTIVAKKVAVLRVDDASAPTRELLKGMAKTLLLVGLVAMLLAFVFASVLARFLDVSWAPSALIGPYFCVALVSGLAFGALQGNLRFGALALSAIAGVVVRLALGIVLTALGLGVTGAMLATVASQLFAGLLALSLARIPPGSWIRSPAVLRPFRRDFRPALLALGAFALHAQLDLILARHYLDANAAGTYSSAGLIARALLFLPGAVATVALPRFAESRGVGTHARRWLHISILATGGIAAFAIPILVGFRESVVTLVLGESFSGAATLLPLLGLAMTAMALVNLLIYFHIAAETRAYRLVFLGVALETALIHLLHETPHQLAIAVLLTGIVTVLLLYHAARAASIWPKFAVTDVQPLGPSPEVDLSVVLPCHNPGSALQELLTELCGGFLGPSTFEIIVVSDGSTDNTVSIARSFGSAVRVIERVERGGKGSALRAGLSEARGRYVAFMDSDGDILPQDLKPFIALMELYQPDIVLGSKRHPLSEVIYPATRRVMSWAYHKLARMLFRVNVRDTQTGLKMIRRDVLAAVLPRMLEKRFAFDLELLVVARLLGYTRVFEAPVRIDFRFESNVNPRQTLRIIVDTLAIFYRRYILATYVPYRSASNAEATPLNGAAVLGVRSTLSQRLASERWRTNDSNGSRPLHILLLNWRDTGNPDAGGAEVYAQELSKEWIRRGHSVDLYTSHFENAARVENIDGVRVHRMGSLRRGTFHLRIQRELARVRGFDVVVDAINAVPFLTPLWRWRLPPVVAAMHQLATDVWRTELPRPLAALGELTHPMLLRLYRDTPTIALSESTQCDLLALGFECVTVIHPGQSEPPQLRSHAKDPFPSVLFVGRLARNKRPDHAVEAFRLIKEQLPQARLALVGRGPMEAELRRSLPDGAELHGFVTRDLLYEMMARAHCIIVPSVREGWGLVVLEANAVGTPAVGYNVHGLRDSIKHEETGYLAMAGDPQDLALQTLRLLTDPSKYESIQRAAMASARTFSWSDVAERWLQFFAEAGVVDTRSVPDEERSVHTAQTSQFEPTSDA